MNTGFRVLVGFNSLLNPSLQLQRQTLSTWKHTLGDQEEAETRRSRLQNNGLSRYTSTPMFLFHNSVIEECVWPASNKKFCSVIWLSTMHFIEKQNEIFMIITC